MRALIVVIVAYLIGSIPFGYLIVRHKVGDDVRETGSGGTGATNVSRRAGKAAGVFTLVLDALKGTIAVLLAQILADGPDGSWSVSDTRSGRVVVCRGSVCSDRVVDQVRITRLYHSGCNYSLICLAANG